MTTSTEKINKSELFKAAWVIVKTTGATISQALNSAWNAIKNATSSILSKASHANYSKWDTTLIQLDIPVNMTDKAVQLTGEIVKGSVWFPLSVVTVCNKFEVEVPNWLLGKKGLNFLA